jgi:hypothetical protein
MLAVTAVIAAAAVAAGCQRSSSTTRSTAAPTTTSTALGPTEVSAAPAVKGAQDKVLVAAGDIACTPGNSPATSVTCQAGATAQTAAGLQPDAVAALGDLQYEAGELSGFQQSYDATWGKLKSITHPALGNHDFLSNRGVGYFTYFAGRGVGDRAKGWYSYDLGAWHVVVLNSNCSVVGCGPGSAQLQFLEADLARHKPACTLAYWHHPRFSSGIHGDDASVDPFWQVLSSAKADLVLSGHDHDYERFQPLDASGAASPADGMRQFVVGTGGRSLYPFAGAKPTSEVRKVAFGVLELTLKAAGYHWRFVALAGSSFSDEGDGTCR